MFSGAGEPFFRNLLTEIGLNVEDLAGSVEIRGEEQPMASPHRITLAGGIALAAQGVAIAAFWNARGGGRQDVAIATADVGFALNPYPWLRRNGHVAHPVDNFIEPCSGLFETQDKRWVYISANYPKLRNGLLKMLDAPNDRAACAAAIGRMESSRFETEMLARGLTGALIRTRDEWEASEQGRHLATRPVIEIERIGDAPPQSPREGGRPLSGIRVADMTHVFAGPMITRCLAEQGADVLHLGTIRPDLVDPVGMAIETSIGKRSAIVDLDLAEDIEALEALLAEADVLVLSWRPDLLASRGLSLERIAALRPGIIFVSVSAFGEGGPWAGRKGFDGMALAATGIMAEQGAYDRLRLSPPGILTDGLVGFLGAAAVASTLLRRAREGGSYHIRLSLARTAMWVQSLGEAQHSATTLVGAGTPGDLRFVGSAGEPRITKMETPFGELEFVAPAIRYSETPGYFERPPVPIGASRMEWRELR